MFSNDNTGKTNPSLAVVDKENWQVMHKLTDPGSINKQSVSPVIFMILEV